MSTLTLGVEMYQYVCGACGGVYAVAENYRANAARNGTNWTCPYCKGATGYAGVGEVDRLKKQLVTEQLARQTAQDRARQLMADAERAKNRSAHGVCPCCTRTFSNVARHMMNKHPEFAARPKPTKAKSKRKPESTP